MTKFIKICGKGDLATVKKMLSENSTDKSKISNKECAEALCCAAESDKINVVKFMMKKGVSTNHMSKTGYTTLMYVSKLGHTRSVKELLKSNKTRINTVSPVHGKTALMLAVENGHHKIVKLLLDNGAKINIKNKLSKKKNNNTAKAVAEKTGDKKMIELFNKKTSNKKTSNKKTSNKK